MFNIKQKIETFCKWFDKKAGKRKKAIIIFIIVFLIIFSPLGWVKKGFYVPIYGESIHTAAFAFPAYCYLEIDSDDYSKYGYGNRPARGYIPTYYENIEGSATDMYYSVGRFFVIDDAYCIGVSVGRYLFMYNRKTHCDKKIIVMKWKGKNYYTKKELEEFREKVSKR